MSVKAVDTTLSFRAQPRNLFKQVRKAVLFSWQSQSSQPGPRGPGFRVHVNGSNRMRPVPRTDAPDERKVAMMKTRGIVILATAILLGAVVISRAQDRASVKSPLTQQAQQHWCKTLHASDYAGIARAYADYIIEHGRDVYGRAHSPLFMTVLNRKTGKPFKASYPHVIAKPYAPGLRRDHKMRPYDRTYIGSNPLEDLPLYGLLYRLSELTGDPRYRKEADKSIAWFLENGWSPKTGLPGWGSHMYYQVEKDMAVFAGGNPNGGYGGHEYNFVWPYWDQHPESLHRFAQAVWHKHIRNKETGHFNRHSTDGTSGMEFPETGSCFMEVWARAYGRSGNPEMKQYIQTLLQLFRSMRHPQTGAMGWCSSQDTGRRELSNVHMNLSMATTLQDAARHVDKRDPDLARELREFVRFIDDEYLSNDYDHILDVAGKGILGWYRVADRSARLEGMTPAPDGVDTSVGFPVQTGDGQPAASLYYLTPWFPGRSYAEFGIKLKNRHMRCEAKHRPTYRRALIDIADIYLTIGPEVQFAQYPDNVSDVVELLRYVHALTGEVTYLYRADQVMRLGLRLFFDETSPLPKITNFDDWYESSLKNESSLEILRQMLELSLDLEALPQSQRTAPQVATEVREGLWHAKVNGAVLGMRLQYGAEKQHTLYLSQSRGPKHWRITLSDSVTRIPSVEEADRLNGRMDKFTGKGHTTASIAYGGFKDVPRQVRLVMRNTGKKTATVQVTATLHDTYHDHGQVHSDRTLKPGEEGAFVLNAPVKRWIRHLAIASENDITDLSLDDLAFAVSPRNQLHTAAATPNRSVSENPVVGSRASVFSTGKDGEAGDVGLYRRYSRTQSSRKTSRSKPDRILQQAPCNDRPARVSLIAGQSNAGGVAAFSPESNVNAGMAAKHPTLPGSTAKEVGIPTDKEAYLELSHRVLSQKETNTWGPFVGPWTRHNKNPIIRLEGKETYSIQNGPQTVIRWKDKWHMFLMTSQPMVTKLAQSDDGLTWTRAHHNYLLKPEMDWEGSYNLAKAAVVRDDEVWLYYFGKKGKTEMVALARSRDLVNWQKEPKPIFTHEDSRIDGTRAFPNCVIQEGDTWYMYYDVGYDYHHPKNPDGYAIGVATSTDGINWTDTAQSPVLITSEQSDDSWDDGMVSQCSVTKIHDWFYMLYSGGTNNHGRKYSGKNRMAFGLARARHPEGPWEKYPDNPVFKPTGNEEDFDGIFLQHACPVKVGNQWRLYYNGWTLNPEARNSIGAEYAIGLACVKDSTPTESGKRTTRPTGRGFD